MIVVTGCPRSGTSLMMRMLRDSLGDDRIVGDKFPMSTEGGRLWMRMKSPNIPDDYIEHHAKKLEDMCPSGYWEHTEYTMMGIRPPAPKPPANAVCKLVGLARTEPSYVDKVIYMLRSPCGVSGSQARLVNAIKLDGSPDCAPDYFGPELFVDYTSAICRFLSEHASPTLVVDLYDLRTMPGYTAGRLSAFLGERVKATGVKRPDYGREKREKHHAGPWWDAAYHMYDLVTKRDWKTAGDVYERTRNAESIRDIQNDDVFGDTAKSLLGV